MLKPLSRIGSLLGVRITTNEWTVNQRRENYIQVWIEVDVSKPLPKAILVENEEGQVHNQTFFIEWVPHFCQKCQVIGRMMIQVGRFPRPDIL